MNPEKRLKRIETSLTPLQAVLRWLKEMLELSYEDHIEKMFANPRNPRVIVMKAVAEAVLENPSDPPLKPDAIQHAAREAMKRADMLMVLIIDLHDHVRSHHEPNGLYAELLAEKYKRLLETVEYRGTFKPEDWEAYGARLNGTLLSVWLLKKTVVSISAQYYDGHPLLFAADEEKLNGEIEYLENLAQSYNRVAHKLFNSKVNQIVAPSSSLAEHVEHRVTNFANWAKVKTLNDFGETDAARTLLYSCDRAGRRELNRLRSSSSQ